MRRTIIITLHYSYCRIVIIHVKELTPDPRPPDPAGPWQVSLNRLKDKGVFCSHIRSVAAAGRVNCLCFDKTGTLTEVRRVESIRTLILGH
jgi:hypothetical protein